MSDRSTTITLTDSGEGRYGIPTDRVGRRTPLGV